MNDSHDHCEHEHTATEKPVTAHGMEAPTVVRDPGPFPQEQIDRQLAAAGWVIEEDRNSVEVAEGMENWWEQVLLED